MQLGTHLHTCHDPALPAHPQPRPVSQPGTSDTSDTSGTPGDFGTSDILAHPQPHPESHPSTLRTSVISELPETSMTPSGLIWPLWIPASTSPRALHLLLSPS